MLQGHHKLWQLCQNHDLLAYEHLPLLVNPFKKLLRHHYVIDYDENTFSCVICLTVWPPFPIIAPTTDAGTNIRSGVSGAPRFPNPNGLK